MPEVIIDPKFREWLVANYGESGAQRILSQYAQDLSVGKSSMQNRYYANWSLRGRPGGEDVPAPQTQATPSWLATQGTPQVGFGGVPFDWTAGLPEIPLTEGEAPPTQPTTGQPDMLGLAMEEQQLRNALLRAQIEQMMGGGQQAQTPAFQIRAQARQATERIRRSEEGLDRRVREGIISALQSELTKLTGARDWIKRWNVQQRIQELQNPPVRGRSVAQRIRAKEAEVESTQAAARRAAVAFPHLTETDVTSGTPEETQALADILKADATLGTLGRLMSGEIGAKEGREGFKASLPPTPEWLAKIYPQLKVGQPIRQQEIAPLSGQQWARMPESTRQGWLGFGEFSGAVPMDLLSLMGQMRTATPSFPRRWRPVKQV